MQDHILYINTLKKGCCKAAAQVSFQQPSPRQNVFTVETQWNHSTYMQCQNCPYTNLEVHNDLSDNEAGQADLTMFYKSS